MRGLFQEGTEPIFEPAIFDPAGSDSGSVIDTYVGSPMYRVIPEHGAAIGGVLALVASVWLVRRLARRGNPRAQAVVTRYRALSVVTRFALWLVAVSATVHLGLVLGHELSVYTGLYLVGAGALFAVAALMLSGRPWRAWTSVVLIGSILGYAVSTLSGEAPDQIALATKLVELAALGVVLTPQPERRLRRLAGSTALVLAMTITAAVAWIGAFTAGDGGHHLGETPPPGVLLPFGEDREPTHAEWDAAGDLYAHTVRAIAPYADPAVAAAAGYDVAGMQGMGFHADNEAYKADGRIFDPERPETLVYAVGPDGPVLIGAMFQMPGIGNPGPAIGGPLTVWHAHDHICFSLTPPALSGLLSPFGACPVGSITVPITNEMIHLWTLPGVEEPFGDIDDEWLREYLGGWSESKEPREPAQQNASS